MLLERRQRLVNRSIEEKYLTENRQCLYIAGESLDFIWDERDVCLIDRMWEQGLSIYDIARSFGRDPDEVAILIIDRSRLGKIKPRKGGVYGVRREQHAKKNI